MVRFTSAFVALLVLACTLPALAQGAPPKRVILVDGTVITGTIVDESADPVVVIGANGVEQRIPRARVAEITDLLQGRFTRYDPARTRLFFSPTARSLGAGNKRFSAYYIFPSIAFGVTDNVDLSGGMTIPLITDSEAYALVNANAKVTLAESDGFAFALGGSALVPLASGEDIPGIGGTFYGIATLGNDGGAVTLGAYGFYITDFGDVSEVGNGTALLVGLEKQISDRFKLLSENYLVIPLDGDSGETLFGSLNGVRFFGDRLAADIAAAVGVIDGEFSTVPIPYLGLSYTF